MVPVKETRVRNYGIGNNRQRTGWYQCEMKFRAIRYVINLLTLLLRHASILFVGAESIFFI